jgi:branched-chain amino acid transport system substrate-binding protein
MIINLLSARKAISALMAGMAFFLLLFYAPGIAMGKAAQKKTGGIYSEADLAFLTGSYLEALESFKKFIKDYPDYPEVVAARYKIARIYYNLGDFQNSITCLMEWLNLYPDNPLRIEVMSLLSDNYNAFENKPDAFRWRITAIKAIKEDAAQDFKTIKSDLNTKIIDLIKSCTKDELEKIAGYATDDTYSPYIYHRLATLSLEENKVDDVKKYAMLLVRSSQEETWVSIGRELLERVSKKTGGENEAGIISIGCLLPLSGDFALYGQEVLEGIELGMDIFNLQHEGRTIELVIKDTKGNADDAAAGLQELVNNDNVTVVIGPLASSESSAAAKKAEELGVPIITFTQKEGITKEGGVVFRNYLTPSKEVQAVLERAMNVMGMKRFAIFYPDGSYGRYLRDLFRDKVKLMGGTVAAVESYKPDQTDFAEGIKKILGTTYTKPDSKTVGPVPALNFDAVFIPDNYQQIAMIAPQFPYYNAFNVSFLGTSLWMSEDLIKSTGSFLQGAIFPVGFSPNSNSEGIEEFLADYNISFQSEPSDLSANGYDTIRLIKEILNKKSIKTRKDFQKELYQALFFGVTGEISFDEKGEVKKAPVLMTIEGENLRVVQ